jgi:hypothetical protein
MQSSDGNGACVAAVENYNNAGASPGGAARKNAGLLAKYSAICNVAVRYWHATPRADVRLRVFSSGADNRGP